MPLTAILTWYCYDYLTPTIADFYEAFLHFDAGFHGRSRMPVVLPGLAIAIACDAVWNYLQARQQYQFL